MKKRKLKMRVVVVLALLVQAVSFGVSCEDAIKSVNGSDHDWRKEFSHPGANGFIKSDADREKYIHTALQTQINEINGVYAKHSDTPPMIAVPTNDTKLTFTAPWEEYTAPMRAKVTGAKDGFVHATLLLPTSAHNGLAAARQWSKQDTFAVMYDDGSGKERPLIPTTTKSLDLVTLADVDIPLVHGKTVKILYYRNYGAGMGGDPGGYMGGRVLELTWDKNEPVEPGPAVFKKFWN